MIDITQCHKTIDCTQCVHYITNCKGITKKRETSDIQASGQQPSPPLPQKCTPSQFGIGRKNWNASLPTCRGSIGITSKQNNQTHAGERMEK